MAKNKKTQTYEADDDTVFGELEEVRLKDTSSIRTAVSRGGGAIPAVLARVFKRKIDEDGLVVLPKNWLEEKLGMDTSKAMKGRPNAIKIKLNVQHGDLVGDGRVWHVGDREKGTLYMITIENATPEVEDKWKNWKPSPKKPKEPKTEVEG